MANSLLVRIERSSLRFAKEPGKNSVTSSAVKIGSIVKYSDHYLMWFFESIPGPVPAGAKNYMLQLQKMYKSRIGIVTIIHEHGSCHVRWFNTTSDIKTFNEAMAESQLYENLEVVVP